MGAGRVTQQNVDVAYSASPTTAARVTTTWVEVLYIPDLTVTFNAAITASGTVTASLDKNRQLSASINANASVGANFGNQKQFVATILAGFTGVGAQLGSPERFTADILSEGAVVKALLSIEGFQLTASITSSATVTARLVKDPTPGNLIQLSQTVATENIINQSPEDTLTLTDDSNPDNTLATILVSNTLNVTQNVLAGKIRPRSTSNTLILTQSVAPFRATSSILNLQQNVVGVIGGFEESLVSQLNLTQLSSPNFLKELDTENTLNLTNSGTPYSVALLSTSNQLFLNTIPLSTSPLGNANPQPGTINDSYVVGVLNLPTKYVTLEAPFPGIQTVITLPPPLLQDTKNLVSDLILRKSMNNVSRTYIQTSDNCTLKYTFSMTRNKGLELQNFFRVYNSEVIRLTNWKGERWKVVLLTNPLNFRQPRRGDPCGATVEVDLEFEGVRA